MVAKIGQNGQKHRTVHSFECPPEMRKQIEKCSEIGEVTKSYVIRQALTEYFDNFAPGPDQES